MDDNTRKCIETCVKTFGVMAIIVTVIKYDKLNDLKKALSCTTQLKQLLA